MAGREVEWLLEELPRLVEAGVVPSETASRIREHYERQPRPRRLPLAVVLLAVLGTLLIGLGIILVLANNWDQLSRPVRAVISFLPLVAAQGLVAYTLARRRASPAWREGSGTFLIAAVGAALALIGQTYNVPGSPAGLLLTWTLLCLPLPYLLNAIVPAILCTTGIAAWAFAQRIEGGNALAVWLLLAALAPFVYRESRNLPAGPRSALVRWVSVPALGVATGVSLEGAVTGLWILAYAGLFAALYGAGRRWGVDMPSVWRRPYFFAGAAGIAVLAFLAGYDWIWQDVGTVRAYFLDSRAVLVATDIAVTAVLVLLGMAAVAASHDRGGTTKGWLYGALVPTALAGFAGAAATGGEVIPVILFNLYLLVLGLGTLAAGIRDYRLGLVNGGMVILSALIIARFFDSEVGFTVRGLAFIALGIAFLVANVFLLRHKGRQPEETT